MVIMLPTPSTSHVSFNNVYEPAEDSFLLLDTLSSPGEIEFLQQRFPEHQPAPFVCEFGPGSGVVLAFVTAHAASIFGHTHVLTAGVDLNRKACTATLQTVVRAQLDSRQDECMASNSALFLDTIQGDLGTCLKDASVDVLIFNPPYVPTEESPRSIRDLVYEDNKVAVSARDDFNADSRLLALSYAGGVDGMETTNEFVNQLPRLLSPTRGVAYLLLCAGNRPLEVIAQIQSKFEDLEVVVAGHSGKKGGRETLQILRIYRHSIQND